MQSEYIFMKIDKREVRSILFITLSNLGDIILTTPVLEKLHDEFPEARVDVITGAPGEGIFRSHSAVREIIVRKKRQTLKERLLEVMDFRRRKYDLVVDLKNSLLPYIVGARFGSFLSIPAKMKNTSKHKKDEHLSKLANLGIDAFRGNRFFIPITSDEKKYAQEIMDENFNKKVVVINPGAKSHLKRWPAEKYAKLADRLVSELVCRVLITGNEDDVDVVQSVTGYMSGAFTDLCCKTSLGALSQLIEFSKLIITNDSAPLHVASAIGCPAVAIFGPSDELRYGPLKEGSMVLKPNVSCRPCDRALCAVGPDEGCIGRVEVEEVFDAAKKILEKGC